MADKSPKLKFEEWGGVSENFFKKICVQERWVGNIKEYQSEWTASHCLSNSRSAFSLVGYRATREPVNNVNQIRALSCPKWPSGFHTSSHGLNGSMQAGYTPLHLRAYLLPLTNHLPQAPAQRLRPHLCPSLPTKLASHDCLFLIVPSQCMLPSQLNHALFLSS